MMIRHTSPVARAPPSLFLLVNARAARSAGAVLHTHSKCRARGTDKEACMPIETALWLRAFFGPYVPAWRLTRASRARSGRDFRAGLAGSSRQRVSRARSRTSPRVRRRTCTHESEETRDGRARAATETHVSRSTAIASASPSGPTGTRRSTIGGGATSATSARSPETSKNRSTAQLSHDVYLRDERDAHIYICMHAFLANILETRAPRKRAPRLTARAWRACRAARRTLGRRRPGRRA